MPRTTIQPDGRVTYRTSLFASLAKAQAFARCLQSNTGRFEHSMVHESQTSKTSKWFVTFEPTLASRKDAIHAGQQEARQARAEEQEFIFWPDPDRLTANGTPMFWWCFSVASGETYEVSIGDCSCPDYQFRCRNAGMNCKHQLAWSSQRATGIIGATDKTTRPSISREEMARRISQDF
jgi:hypothetical protein